MCRVSVGLSSPFQQRFVTIQANDWMTDCNALPFARFIQINLFAITSIRSHLFSSRRWESVCAFLKFNIQINWKLDAIALIISLAQNTQNTFILSFNFHETCACSELVNLCQATEIDAKSCHRHKHRLFASGRNSVVFRPSFVHLRNWIVLFISVACRSSHSIATAPFTFRGKFKFASARRSFVDTSMFYNVREICWRSNFGRKYGKRWALPNICSVDK